MRPAVLSRADEFLSDTIGASFPAPDADSGIALVGAAALRVLNNNQNRPVALQRRSAECLKHDVVELVPVSHSPRPFDPKYVEGDRQMYPASKPGTSREPRRVTKQSALKLVAKALDATVGDKASPVKHIQKAADVDRSTAASWLKGHNLLGAHHLLNLMIEWPEFAAEVRRVYTMERELHEDLTREISALVRRAMQR